MGNRKGKYKHTSTHVCERCGGSVTYFNSNRAEHTKGPSRDMTCADPPKPMRRTVYLEKYCKPEPLEVNDGSAV